MLNSAFIEAKIECSGIPTETVLTALGFKHMETLTKQLRIGTIRINKLNDLFTMLQFTDLEAAYACGDLR